MTHRDSHLTGALEVGAQHGEARSDVLERCLQVALLVVNRRYPVGYAAQSRDWIAERRHGRKSNVPHRRVSTAAERSR
jgi:hypothetical protein